MRNPRITCVDGRPGVTPSSRPDIGTLPHALLTTVLLLNVTVILGWSLLDGTTAAALDPVYRALCHRVPERCLHVGSQAMPVCARCLGVWMGLALAAMSATSRLRGTFLWRRRTAWLFAGLLLADWCAGVAGVMRVEWHLERAAAGLAGGFAACVLLTWLVSRLRAWGRRVLRSLGVWLCIGRSSTGRVVSSSLLRGVTVGEADGAPVAGPPPPP